MSESLKSKTAKSVLWSAIERFSVQGIQFFFEYYNCKTSASF